MAQFLDRYVKLMQDLLPIGEAWTRRPDSNLTKLLQGMAAEYNRAHCEADRLLVESQPCTTFDLLPDWERIAGLPDECTEEFSNLTDRRTQLKQKLSTRGGQNEQFFIDIALIFGVDSEITIDNAVPCRSGQCRSGDRIYGLDWIFVWFVNTATFVGTVTRSGSAQSGDRLREFGNDALICTIKKLKPAHTQVIFTFGP